MAGPRGRPEDMTAKLARHRAAASASVARSRASSPDAAPRPAAHRSGSLRLLGTGLLALVVVAALTVVLLGMAR